MQVIRFEPGQPPAEATLEAGLPAQGFLWIDIDREQDAGWDGAIEAVSGLSLHEQHRRDLANVDHPSFYDGTADYEMLIFRSLAPEAGGETFPSRALGLLLAERLLVTVHQTGSASVARVTERLLTGHARIPTRPVGLLHLLLNTVVDRFLDQRETLARQVTRWRDELLDPRDPFDDWLSLLRLGSRLRELEELCEGQVDAVVAWQENTGVTIDEHLAVRLADLREHINRVHSFAEGRQTEIESLVQLHFSAVAHRTNEIVRVLTVISAIFLPLSLIAGIFGMNFENMPELKLPYAYFFALGGMASLGVGMFALFKLKRWV
ncbi:MAG TPA: magnesium transporter CorA family protein [Gammaproteobacteria bacterium]